MSILSVKSIIAFTLLMTQIIYQIAAQATRKQCPKLVRTNNWEIEKFFGSWNGIELYSHNTYNGSEFFVDSCLKIYLAEVNELNEEMTYGITIDPFNFRLALRHLKVKFIRNHSKTTQFFMTFNNSNQMLWQHGSDVVMQMIKFDGVQMMMSICVHDGEKGQGLYTILANRDYSDERKHVDSTHLNRLILQGRNLKVVSKFNLTVCDVEPEFIESTTIENFTAIETSTMVEDFTEISSLIEPSTLQDSVNISHSLNFHSILLSFSIYLFCISIF